MSISATAATPPIAQPKAAYKVLGALSASHMINDMMQSLILAMYPILKGDFHLSFAPDRAHHSDLPANRFAAPAADRPVHRPSPAALFAAVRHGVYVMRADPAGVRVQLSEAC